MSKQPDQENPSRQDPTAETRKQDHIALAFESRVGPDAVDDRFDYEPLLSGHPDKDSLQAFPFLGKHLKVPVWVSSMTGGTHWAGTINHNLARACGEFGMGMGLGSCRSLLYSDEHLADFDVRHLIGPDLPLFANLGIAQVETLLEEGKTSEIDALIDRLQADGLIVHINPLQEAMQPEGDHIRRPPIETIRALLEQTERKLIVKEVGQGMGPASLKALLELPLAAVDFAASGGTNFALLELLRAQPEERESFRPLARVGHSADQMVALTNSLAESPEVSLRCRELIISGGVNDFLDGYYLVQRSLLPAVYGKASGFLRHARGEYSELKAYVERQVRGLELAYAFLRVRQTAEKQAQKRSLKP